MNKLMNKLMTLYNKINYACSHGYYVKVKAGDGDWCIVSPNKDAGSEWRNSGWGCSIKDAATELGCCFGNREQTWNNRESQGATYEGIYKPEHELYEVGEKVIYKGDEYLVECDFHNNTYELVGLRYLPSHFELEPYFETGSTEPVRTLEDILSDLPEEDKKILKEHLK